MFKRFPKLLWRPRPYYPLVPADVQAQYPLLTDDFAVLEQTLIPRFKTLDSEALRMQNLERRAQVLIIVGATVASVLGLIQASGETPWASYTELALTLLLIALAWWTRRKKYQERYLTNRLKAERLRSEYFLFLGRAPLYADDNRQELLTQRINNVIKDEQPR